MHERHAGMCRGCSPPCVGRPTVVQICSAAGHYGLRGFRGGARRGLPGESISGQTTPGRAAFHSSPMVAVVQRNTDSPHPPAALTAPPPAPGPSCIKTWRTPCGRAPHVVSEAGTAGTASEGIDPEDPQQPVDEAPASAPKDLLVLTCRAVQGPTHEHMPRLKPGIRRSWHHHPPLLIITCWGQVLGLGKGIGWLLGRLLRNRLLAGLTQAVLPPVPALEHRVTAQAGGPPRIDAASGFPSSGLPSVTGGVFRHTVLRVQWVRGLGHAWALTGHRPMSLRPERRPHAFPRARTSRGHAASPQTHMPLSPDARGDTPTDATLTHAAPHPRSP
jgi:hypothetical protein